MFPVFFQILDLEISNDLEIMKIFTKSTQYFLAQNKEN